MLSDFWGKVRRGAHPISLWRLLDYLTDLSVRTDWNKSSSHEPSRNIIMLVRVGAWIFSPLLRSEQLCGWVTWPPFPSIIECSATLRQSHRWLISKDKTPEVGTALSKWWGNNLITNRLKSSKVVVFLHKVSAFVCLICCHLSTLAQGLQMQGVWRWKFPQRGSISLLVYER